MEFIKKEYNYKLRYNYWVSVAISRGHYELVLIFLEKVPSIERKGTKDYNNDSLSLTLLYSKLIS